MIPLTAIRVLITAGFLAPELSRFPFAPYIYKLVKQAAFLMRQHLQ